MTKLTILVVCLLVISSLAENNEAAKKSATSESDKAPATPTAHPASKTPLVPFPERPNGLPGPYGPTFNTEETVIPRQFPGYPEGPEGIPQFNPYASPQLGFGGFYPQLQPIQPQQPQGLYPGQPQIVYYSGTGQPFLVNPGNPPGNFLIPQYPQSGGTPSGVDPSIFTTQPIYPPLTPQNPQIPQQPPVYVNGSPKQPVVPPIDKDAEEIPKDIPVQGGPSNVPSKQKPQKVELGDTEEVELQKPVQPGTPQHGNPQAFPNVPNLLNLRPGQRFFILNGQPLFSNYPGFGYQHPNLVPERYANPYIERQPQRQHFDQQQFKPLTPSLASIIVRDQAHLVRQQIVPAHLKGHTFPQHQDGLPITLHNQVVEKNIQSVVMTPTGSASKDALQSRYYEKTIPFDEHQIPLQQDQVQPVFDEPAVNFDYYKYNDGTDSSDDSAVIIDAKYQEPNEVEDDTERETEKPAESSVAEAQPGAIALAGEGGVAAAGPRGTALAGEGGLAISSPHATAVAGPAKDDVLAVTTEGKQKPTNKSK